ncbi:MAG: DJ-1/PfpI family protein [Methanothrix sp.]|nr:DJ-1/PfpI family protein [Methanothrix sp.]
MEKISKKRVGMLLFPDIELLDFCGPYEVFSVFRFDEEKGSLEPSPFDIYLIAENKGTIKTRAGLEVVAEYSLADHPPFDILVVPGGWGTRKEITNDKLINWIRKIAQEVELVTAVCTGSMLLGRAGLLVGKRATTHWQSLQWMKDEFPDTIVEDALHVVEDGNIITSAGISAGIDMALKVVQKYYGVEIARNMARYMEYRYTTDNERRISHV